MRIFLVTLAALSPLAALADPVWAIRPEPGLICMAVSSAKPILDQPHGRPTATSGQIVFVFKPMRPQDGFVEIERPNRQVGWIEQDILSPAPNCTPTLMSNGLILTGSTR